MKERTKQLLVGSLVFLAIVLAVMGTLFVYGYSNAPISVYGWAFVDSGLEARIQETRRGLEEISGIADVEYQPDSNVFVFNLVNSKRAQSIKEEIETTTGVASVQLNLEAVASAQKEVRKAYVDKYLRMK